MQKAYRYRFYPTPD
ncbi:MAG: helix-turn-helix domain-containing protein [Microcystis sp.]|uniref:Helix-turn-helix domain-containing protein n=1 Tax=Microcystis aeruginosa G11-04 TaxID=2685956 RepID=A0A966FY31_MICAE|nr:helix-turn-helix domain-containing protein [Microcystis aeruginosa W13-16]NCQ74101.1 helix-turn-helix domain-containing protein [Microcystis aeruginosa W13-13]NCQ78588.1 helix-turn-helix domain-containing protein [Microcystis aeruginosa W13-15]NCR22300.1 helix-turn-helix domain-containing protein [Microcystis aeruginosa L111-01]NCR25468.1 helix-turn-helix domain-containing protein [Microcystis aeruginosa LE13-04]NCR89118.1 helix-turn-helix domain-containing protein [Microcystis aeruginosa G